MARLLTQQTLRQTVSDVYRKLESYKMKRLIYTLILTLSSIVFLISCGNNGRYYKWVEGVWEGEDENGDWAVAEISPSGYKYVCSNWCDSPLDINNQEESPLDIKLEENHLIEKKVYAINDYLYIDPKKKAIIAILGEYTTLPLSKKSSQSTSDVTISSLDESDGKSNPSDIQKSYHNDNRKELLSSSKLIPPTKPYAIVYGWENDNLKGKVKRLEEQLIKIGESSHDQVWAVVKEYDTLGRITYYDRDGDDPDHINLRSTVISLGFPKENIDGLGLYHLFRLRKCFNPYYMLGYNASTDKVNFEPPYTFSYNEDGLMDKIYSYNELVYTCEYDDYGNLVKRTENGLPTLQIRRNYGSQPSYEVRKYSTNGIMYESVTYKISGHSITTNAEARYKILESDDVLRDDSDITTFAFDDISIDILYEENNRIKKYDGSNEYTYNDKGDIIKYFQSDVSPAYGGPRTDIWKYQYDANGNWTKATKYKVISGDIQIEQELETITRKYEYYE